MDGLGTSPLRLGPDIPVVCVANKIDVEPGMAKKKFNFPVTHQLPFFFAPGQQIEECILHCRRVPLAVGSPLSQIFWVLHW